MKYKVGDIFVSSKVGVVTIIEQQHSSDNETWFKCKVYDRELLMERIEVLSDTTFNRWREYRIFKFYPVVGEMVK